MVIQLCQLVTQVIDPVKGITCISVEITTGNYNHDVSQFT